MRRLLFSAMLLCAACACGSPTTMPEAKPEAKPDWSGPPLQVTSLADRGLRLELLAPTSGHMFDLRAVVQAADGADVQLVHRTPGDAIVAQVITPLSIEVPAERLAEARRVRVWITTLRGKDDSSEPPPALAFVLTRP